MGRTVYRRMDILKQIADAVTGIGEKVFITDRPAAEQKAMKDFVVIRLPQTIQDKGSTYQDTYCQINVFAHDRSNGIENTVRLDENANGSGFKISNSDGIVFSCKSTIASRRK